MDNFFKFKSKYNIFLCFIFFIVISKSSYANYFFCKSYLGPNYDKAFIFENEKVKSIAIVNENNKLKIDKNFGDDQYSFKFGKVRWGEYKPYKFSLDRVHLTLLDFTSPNHLSNRYQCYKLKGIEYIDINMNLSLDLTLKKIKR